MVASGRAHLRPRLIDAYIQIPAFRRTLFDELVMRGALLDLSVEAVCRLVGGRESGPGSGGAGRRFGSIGRIKRCRPVEIVVAGGPGQRPVRTVRA